MAGIEDLIEVYRGEPLLDRKWPKFKADKITPEKMRGRWFTKSKNVARFFADKFPSVIKSAKIPIKSFDIGKKLQKAAKLGSYLHPNEFLMPRNQLGKVKVNLLQTFLANAKALSPLAIKGLNTLASLPVATLTMVLQSTPANADEANMKLEDFAKLVEEAQPKKEMMAAGGIAGMLGEPRSGYQGGGGAGYEEYWKMVRESFYSPEVGGKEKTGLDIHEFADIYFPRKAEGGRIGLAEGMRYVPDTPLYDYKTDKEGKSFIPYGALDREMFKQELDDPRNKMDMDFDRDTDLVDVFIYYKNQGLNIKDFVQKFGFKNLLKSHRELKEAGVIRDRVDLLPSDYEKSQKRMNQNQGGRIGLAKGNGATTKKGLRLIDRQRLHFLKKLKDIYEKEWLEDWNPKDPTYHAEGGRIGFGEGDTPSEAYLRDIFMSIPGGDQLGTMSFEEWKSSASGQHYKDKWISEHRPKFDNGGPVFDIDLYNQLIAEGVPKDQAYNQASGGLGSEMQEEFDKIFGKAEGGRIGFKDGEGIMSRVGDMVDVRNVPYYSGKALQGLVNSAETLSKFPFAAGELGSKLIQQPPKKEMFMKAIEDITPGSWSENVGLTSLVEGMAEERPEDAQTVGNVLGLGTEIAVPTGGAFKAGQFLLSKASKAMGKVKDGKTLEKLVDQKLTDSGQSRRDFNIMAAASGLMVALKTIGLGGLLKGATKVPTTDFTVKLRTQFLNSDVDYGTSGLAYFDISALTSKVKKVLHGFMKNKQATKPGLKGKDYMNIEPGDAKKVIKKLQDAGFKGKITGIVDESGDVLQQAEKAGWKNFVDDFKKSSMRKNIAEHKRYEDFVVYENDPGFMNWNKATKGKLDKPYVSTIDEVVDLLEPVVKKAEGGRIGLDAGGPPISGEELKQMKKEVGGSGIMDFLKITGSGGMSSNEDIYDQGQRIPGLDQKQYNYGFNVDANIPFNLPGGGQLELQGGTGFGRGRTETTYKGEPVPGMSGMGESKLGDQWNIGAKITYPFANGGLTKTIPPKRGPMPQGLPSALYNGIMRPRSY